jgi:hypothetical protein
MKNTLVVVADLACFKAYKVDQNQVQRTPRLELIEHFANPQAHEKTTDQVSDASGRFRLGSAPGGVMSDGDRHNSDLEQRKRLVRQLAQRLNTVARDQGFERCLLAASKEINRALVDALDPALRALIEKNIPADLTKIERAQILAYF